jgi:hypothetical protein
MKYQNEKVVGAIYTNGVSTIKNPYIEALPEILSYDDFMKEIASFPSIPMDIYIKSPEERRSFLSEINNIFYPMDYMYYIYDLLYRAIKDNYSSKNTIETIQQINHLYKSMIQDNVSKLEYSTQSFSGSILGTPGIGKSSTVRRSLSLMPQVIIHSKYNGEAMYVKQIVYLCVECPSDCSVKTLAMSIMSEIDKTIGSNYFDEIAHNPRSRSASTLAIKVKIACLNHKIGIIVIDEIQNAVVTASKNNQLKPLIRFLVELTNEACVSICFVGTLLAEEIFCSQEHLKRRTRGFRLLPLKPDKTYMKFLESIWKYQWTLKKAEMKENIMNLIYDYSGGIPSYMLLIFLESQSQAIMSGKEKIDITTIKKTIGMLQINVNKPYSGGTSISDFCVGSDMDDSENEDLHLKSQKRGRPITARESEDLISMFKRAADSKTLITNLELENLVEKY